MSNNYFQKCIDKIRGKKKINVANPKLAFGEKFIYSQVDSQDLISSYLLSDKPVLMSRFGTVELETVRQYLKHQKRKEIFDPFQKEYMEISPGFFPVDDYNMTKFACEQIEVTKKVDIMSVRREKFEEEMCLRYLPENSKLVDINSLSSPMNYSRPWSKHLAGKKVLVIHPFENSIRKQYAKRDLLFKNPEVLPEFELLTYKPVQGIADSKKDLPFETWFDALDYMKNDISKIDYDVAIIGAGAYGMFLGAFCKDMGKKAIHIGGATQILFGIKGKRWDSCGYYNEHWIRPSADETPKGVEKLEHGTFAYW